MSLQRLKSPRATEPNTTAARIGDAVIEISDVLAGPGSATRSSRLAVGRESHQRPFWSPAAGPD